MRVLAGWVVTQQLPLELEVILGTPSESPEGQRNLTEVGQGRPTVPHHLPQEQPHFCLLSRMFLLPAFIVRKHFYCFKYKNYLSRWSPGPGSNFSEPVILKVNKGCACMGAQMLASLRMKGKAPQGKERGKSATNWLELRRAVCIVLSLDRTLLPH